MTRMNQFADYRVLTILCVAALLTIGCQRGGGTAAQEGDHQDSGGASVHGHDHGERGPRGGTLIELGAHEFHAEIVHDKSANEIVVYLLDAAADKPVHTDAERAVINLVHHGEPEQHVLLALPMPDDPPGRTSRFVARDNPELPHDLSHHDARARLQVVINGKTLVGSIPLLGDHGHDHE